MCLFSRCNVLCSSRKTIPQSYNYIITSGFTFMEVDNSSFLNIIY